MHKLGCSVAVDAQELVAAEIGVHKQSETLHGYCHFWHEVVVVVASVPKVLLTKAAASSAAEDQFLTLCK